MFGPRRSKPGLLTASSSLSAGIARNSFNESVPRTFFAYSALFLARSVSVTAGSERCEKSAPLSPIARWNNPFASGEAINSLTENDPALSPKIVTFPGSPPNAAIFFFTHSRAATWSSNP